MTNQIPSEEQIQKLAIRALSRDTWSVCDDLRPDPANDDELVALLQAALMRGRSTAHIEILFDRARHELDV